MDYTIYEIETGEIRGDVSCDIDDISLIYCPPNCKVISGIFDRLKYKIINNSPVERDANDKIFIDLKINEINNKYEKSILSLTHSITENEISTWLKQEQEARNWILDNTVSTPLIDGMLVSRTDHTKETLVNKIIEKADLYASEVGKLLGEKQKKEKEILQG